MRSKAEHDCPALKYVPSTRFAIVPSSGASGRTYAAPFPPPSRFVAMNWRGAAGQRALGDADHVGGALLKSPSNLQRTLGEGPPHLPRQLGRDSIGAADHQLHRAAADRGALVDGHVLPAPLSRDRPLEHRIEIATRRQLDLRAHRSVDGTNRSLELSRHDFRSRLSKFSPRGASLSGEWPRSAESLALPDHSGVT